MTKLHTFKINKNIFNLECVNHVASMFTNNYYISLEDEDSECYKIIIKSKDENNISNSIEDEFKNLLIDHKTWLDLTSKFGSLRDKIVEQAFSSTKR